MFAGDDAFRAIEQWGNHIRENIIDLKKKISTTQPNQVSTIHNQILSLNNELQESQLAVDEAVNNYQSMVEEYLQQISENGFIFSPRDVRYNIKTFDLLVAHSIVVSNTELLNKWAIVPLKNKKCEEALGANKSFYRKRIKKLKARTESQLAKKCYDYIIEKLFTETN